MPTLIRRLAAEALSRRLSREPAMPSDADAAAVQRFSSWRPIVAPVNDPACSRACAA